MNGTESAWKRNLPQPVYDEKPEYCDLYNFAWELAKKHVRHIEGMPADPYMDEAFCDTRIWIWDTCFMTLFCKYSPKDFPGVESFRNLIDVIHNGLELPEVDVPDTEPWWTHSPRGGRSRILIQHPDNPPLFAWAEYENVLMTGNLDRIRRILHDSKNLQKHYDWLESLTESVAVPKCSIPTAWCKREKGYLWSGTPSGMDNTPRGRSVHTEPEVTDREFFWIDALAQQTLSANCICKMAELIGDSVLAGEWKRRFEEKKSLLEKYYWDEQDGFYYDIGAKDLAFRKIVTPASFWPLTAEASTKEHAARCVEKLMNPELLGGKYPWVSVARNDALFQPVHGQYWHGAIWAPTAYAGVRGLLNYGFYDEARSTTLAFLEQMYRTWKDYEPHTIWECYAPNSCEPGRDAFDKERVRKDFCGWSAVLPISAFLEAVIGITRANAFTRTVEWNPPVSEKRIGCRNYCFGSLKLDMIKEGNHYEIFSNGPCKLILNGIEYAMTAGKNTFVTE